MYTIKIDNQYLPYYVKVKSGSLQMNQTQAGERTVLSFILIDTNETGQNYNWNFLIGKKVELYDDGILKFGGQLDEPSIRKIDEVPKMELKVQCIDWTFIADKTYINQSYSRQLISDTVKDMIDEFLVADGIWYDDSSIQETTAQYVSINCPYVIASDAFNELKDLINWQWKIRADKKFFLTPYTTDVGESLIENVSNYTPKSLIVNKNRDEYFNTLVYKNVNALTDQLTEKATPTPEQDRSYFVRFQLNQKPELYISTNVTNPPKGDMVDSRDVGIGGLETGLDWYWNKGSNIIQQDLDADEIPSGKFLVVKYVGQYKIDIIEQDSSAIVERQSIEGGTGIYSHIETASEVEGIAVAESKAQAVLEKNARITNKISFDSFTIDLEVGQIIDVRLPSFNIDTITGDPGNSDYYLVIEKRTKDIGRLLLKSYTLIDGAPLGGWVRFFAKLIKPGKDWEIRPDAQVDISINVDEEWDWAGQVTIQNITPLFPIDDPGGLYPSNLLFPGTSISSQTVYD